MVGFWVQVNTARSSWASHQRTPPSPSPQGCSKSHHPPDCIDTAPTQAQDFALGLPEPSFFSSSLSSLIYSAKNSSRPPEEVTSVPKLELIDHGHGLEVAEGGSCHHVQHWRVSLPSLITEGIPLPCPGIMTILSLWLALSSCYPGRLSGLNHGVLTEQRIMVKAGSSSRVIALIPKTWQRR